LLTAERTVATSPGEGGPGLVGAFRCAANETEKTSLDGRPTVCEVSQAPNSQAALTSLSLGGNDTVDPVLIHPSRVTSGASPAWRCCNRNV
jgi:hypothetical protein